MTDQVDERRERGLRVLQSMEEPRVVQGFLDALGGASPDLADLLLGFVCADLIDRPGLSVREKELITLAVIAAQGGADRMLATHVGAARHLGISDEDILAVFIHVAGYAGFPRAITATLVAAEVLRVPPTS
ncbi:4-carboxymuconolactone decarboxylase [Allocatelliglobosispora scoriae]|uniref:4-carboxymuconolactone decarboxylase n=1 Tax=Allocatelliglobosispora scoriae TaxID=643052 RepID=A0A841BKK6_9ACTN|nr:carboxymuconolactone decarboxylase family protein [Allocatelliglobosispora scoriae]MBB5867766.1 4-carboxymuconolactone decarboxylase [Allocatelliglobosispora scoriae]